MSEMVDEVSGNPGDSLNVALVAFTGCVGSALEDICTYGLTIGEAYVPFDPDPEDDCEDDEAACSQAWVRVMNITPTTSEGWDNDCAVAMRIDLEVGVLRCLELKEEGEAPTASEMLEAAMQAMTDMNALYCAAMACDVWDAIDSGQWSPMGPMGGQYGGTWTFTVELA